MAGKVNGTVRSRVFAGLGGVASRCVGELWSAHDGRIRLVFGGLSTPEMNRVFAVAEREGLSADVSAFAEATITIPSIHTPQGPQSPTPREPGQAGACDLCGMRPAEQGGFES